MPHRPKKVKRPWLPERSTDRKSYENDSFYQSATWRRLSKHHKRNEPLCRMCKERGIYRAGEISDHIIPISERPDLALDLDNLQNLCRACHNRKTAKEK